MPKARKRGEFAYEYMKDKILRQEWLPGQPLKEMRLADELEMSRTPVRYAFSKLEEEGYVHTTPHVGVRVAPLELDLEKYQEYTEIIEVVLQHYFRKLERDQVDFDAASAQEILEEMKEHQEEDTALFEELEMDYWESIIYAGTNEQLIILLRQTLKKIVLPKASYQEEIMHLRKLKIKHFTLLADYLSENNYELARREVHILFNQLVIYLIQLD